MYSIYQEQFIEEDIDTIWDFFSNPNNLQIITPDELNFTVLTKQADVSTIKDGMLIDYTITPFAKIKFYWQTEIEKVVHPSEFIDTQKKGPYKRWHHQHLFYPKDNGVLMIDKVEYALPFSPISNLFHFIVRKKLERIFAFRKAKIEEIFS